MKKPELKNSKSTQRRVDMLKTAKAHNAQLTGEVSITPISIKRLPSIEIDKEAIRFEFVNGDGVNLFWVDLFNPKLTERFHTELFTNIFRAYNECVINDCGISE